MSDLSLSVAERTVLSGWRCCSWHLVVCLVLVPVVGWIILRMRMSVDGENTLTIHNPDRLEDLLRMFARNDAGGGSDHHRTEALCRSLLEKMLNMKLPKVRPKWLVNPTTKRCLELDMYNEEHQLAFEYDGAQHNTFTPHYHKNKDHFEYRCLLDRLKTELCRERGVLLIRIAWHAITLKDKVQTSVYLESLLRRHRIPFRSLAVPA